MANVLIPKKSTVAAKVPTTSDLALGEIAINYADQKIYGRDPSSGTVKELGGAAGSLSIDTTAADLFSASSGTLTADDPGADRLFFWDDSAGRATHLEVGSGLAITGTTLSNTGGLSGTGSVDNAILRADGTGGATLQNSGIVIDDATTSTQNNVAITNQHSGQTNSALVLSPKGTGALLAHKPNGAVSGGNARGVNAVDLQLIRETASQVASGAQSFVVNYSNTASGQASAAFGYASTASALGAFACGNSAAGGSYAFSCGQNGGTGASGANSAVVGGTGNRSTQTSAITLGGSSNTADATNAVAAGDNTYCPGNTAFGIGQRALGDRLRMFAHASGQFAAFGDAQRARFVLRNKTTTNSAVELFLDGSATRLTIPSGKVLALTINICGISSTGAAVAHYMRQYALKNVSGTTSEVYAPVTIGTDNAAGTSIALSASDASDALIVSVTGTASTIWRWVASVDAVEIAFGI